MWAAVAVAAAVLAGVVLGATPARAASVGWIPSDWVSVASGAIGDVRAALGGGAVSVVGASGSAMTQGEYRVAPDGGNHRAGRWEAQAGSDVVRFTFVLESAAGYTGSLWPEEGSWLGQYGGQGSVQLLCSDGAVTADYEFGQGSGYWSTSSALVASQAWRCSNNGHGSLVGLEYIPNTDAQRVYRTFTYRFNAEVPAVTTAVTCRNLSTGSDQVVSETSAGPAAPSPVCPSGSVPVRVRVSQGSSVLSDASITSTALDRFAGYIGDPGAWEWRSGSDPSNCYIQKSADPTMVIALSVSVCSEAHDNGYGQAEESTDCAGDLVCSAVEGAKSVIARILTGIATTANRIAEAVERVRSAVVGGIQSIVDAVQSVVQKITETADRIIEAINGVIEAIETGFRGLFDRWDQGLPGDGGGGGEGPGPGDVGPGDIGDPGDITSKFTPWTDALGDVIGGANRGDPGCKGPRVHFVMSGVVFDSYPLDACTAPMSTVAALCNAGIAVMVVVSGGLACIRIIASAFGLQTGQRGDA